MTGIEWTDATWNPVVGCTRASRGCDHCYAVTMTHRLGAMAKASRLQAERESQLDDGVQRPAGKLRHYEGLTVLNPRGDRHFNGTVRCIEEALPEPLRWKKPRRVFVNSMSDLFHADVPFEFIDRVFAVMALCPQHTFQVLTKRPARMYEYLDLRTNGRGPIYDAAKELNAGSIEGYQFAWPLPSVWLGTSVEDQAAADMRIPRLLKCPAAVRFISAEPLLGPVDLQRALNIERSDAIGWMPAINGAGPNIDWVIVGGESGKGARPCDVAWIRSIVQQCRAAGVPVFVKQMGAVPVEHVNPFNAGAWGQDQKAIKFDAEHVAICLQDRKGGDPAEWPKDLRVRQWPKGAKP